MNASSENVLVTPPVSNKTTNRDFVTPHKISVVLLVAQQCQLKERGTRKVVEDDPELSPKFTARFCMVALKLIQTPDLDYSSFVDICKNKPALELSPVLLKGLFETVENLLRDGVGALLTLMSNTTRLIGAGKGGCAKYSVLGLYLRRVLLSFDKLTFAQVVELFGEFQKYATLSPNKQEDDDHPGRWTRKEAEQFFAREATRLLAEEPAPLQEKISNLLQCNPDFAEAHFLSFLNCVRSKELCGAKDSLHQCFDRALSPPDKLGNGGEERFYRYGTLNLAAMHVLFGNKDEAMLALKEVMQLSHNAGDSVCLQHSLSWLYQISAENRGILLHRAMGRCSDLELGYLMSLAIQAFSKYSGLTGGRPSAVFDVVMKSDVLNCQQVLTELPANSYGLKSALWGLYGQSNMSALYSQQLLRLRGSLQSPVCLSLCNVARYLADQGEYEHAMTVLSEAQDLFPRQQSEAWMISYQEVHFSHLVNQARYGEASECVAMLAPVRPRESSIRKIWLNHLTGDDLRAMASAQDILKRCNEHWFSDPELPPLKVRALLAAAECLPPGEALWYLLQALSLSQSYYLHYLAAVITVSIANTLLEWNLAQRATRLVETSLPYLMAHGSATTRGRALVLLAHCRLAVPEGGSSRADLAQTVNILTTAQDWLNKAQDYVRVKHCWYLKALIHHTISQTAERNKCSFEFRQLEEIYPTPNAFFSTF